MSARQIAQRLNRPDSSVRYPLTEVLGYRFLKTRWVPHALTAAQCQKRVEDAKALLTTLETAKRRNFNFFVTGDESWFFYQSPVTGLWLPSSHPRPEAQKPSHYAPKTMITVFWNVHGPVVIEALPPGGTWTADYFNNVIIEKLAQSDPYRRAIAQKQAFVVHMDNAPVHRAATVKQKMWQIGMHNAEHPAYSPDLAPSDFYLFGNLKSKIRRLEFESAEEIKEWIIAQFDLIPADELKRVFEEWEMRLRACIERGGDYVE